MSPSVEDIRKDFPIFSYHESKGKRLVYLDSAASTQKPQVVIDALSDYYAHSHANIHRGVYDLSMKATQLHDKSRKVVQEFLGAAFSEEIIFLRGTTEGINLVVNSMARDVMNPQSNVVISLMEHHANFVPWQMLCKEIGCELRIIPVDASGCLDMEEAQNLIDNNTAVLSIVHVSNTLGTINPIKELIALAKQVGAYTLVDGAQAVAHFPVDVQELDCDFYVFSGHKLFAPTGIGVLYGKKALLEQMSPYQYGGDMIRFVRVAETQFNQLPYKFEAGTPDIGGAIALAKAIEYVQELGWDWILRHNKSLLTFATEQIEAVNGLRFIGTSQQKIGVISFTLEGIHPHDMGTLLNEKGIAVRTGHHCTMPLMEHLGIPGTTRASLSLYNTEEDIDQLIEGIQFAQSVFL